MGGKKEEMEEKQWVSLISTVSSVCAAHPAVPILSRQTHVWSILAALTRVKQLQCPHFYQDLGKHDTLFKTFFLSIWLTIQIKHIFDIYVQVYVQNQTFSNIV